MSLKYHKQPRKNKTGTCKLFKSFDSTAIIKSEFTQNQIQADRIRELEKSLKLTNDRLIIATRIVEANQLRMAQQEEKLVNNFSSQDFNWLYSQYQTRMQTRIECYKKLERAYPELAKVAEATSANVKYDLPTAPLCIGNTLDHVVSSAGTCRSNHLPALPEGYTEHIPTRKEAPVTYQIFSGKII